LPFPKRSPDYALVHLSDRQKAQLHRLIKRGRASARQITRAHTLLQADAGTTDAEIAEHLHTSVATVERTRKKLAQHGMEQALTEKPRPGGTATVRWQADCLLGGPGVQ
jgi:predicted transcriptional regulator